MPVYRIKGLKRSRVNETMYIYHRATGKRVHATEGTPEFLVEVAALDAEAKGATPRPRSAPDTWAWLVENYLLGPEFANLAPRTKKDYRGLIDYLRPMGDVPLHRLTPAQVIKLRDKTNAKHGRSRANYVLAIISTIWNWGTPREMVPHANPTEKVRKIPRPREARTVNRPWSDRELDTVLSAATGGVRLAVALGAFTGLREGDALSLPWSAVENGWIVWTQSKTGEPLEIPVHPELAAIMAETERRSPIMVTGKRGRPFTGDGFRTEFFKLIRALREAGTIGEGITFHGLRHTVATRLADAGADDRTIMSITGHKRVDMVARYTRKADSRKRAEAGMKLLEGNKTAPSLAKPAENLGKKGKGS